jgi:hypothetical protein
MTGIMLSHPGGKTNTPQGWDSNHYHNKKYSSRSVLDNGLLLRIQHKFLVRGANSIA